ncbi:MAG: geopeptide radical SAM maturase [Desulfobacteraceae bacterium]|nr:geopeptide radical SAM maturase [Desulfobacteraceae bacterium]
MQPSCYLKALSCDEATGTRILFSTRTAAIVRVKEELYHALQNGDLPADHAASLARLGLTTYNPTEEQNAMLGFFDRMNAGNPELHIVAVLNLDCNFSCIYCYEGNTKGRLYMSAQTAERLMDFIRSRLTAQKTDLRIDFYGGEPLLSMDRIRQIAGASRALAREKGTGFRFNLVTNGSLFTRKNAAELAGLGLDHVRITVDGTAETHNQARPFKGGAGSFDTLIKNISETWDLVRIGIGGNYEYHNYRSFVSLLDYLTHIGLTPDRISAVKFDPVMKPPAGDTSLPEFYGGCASLDEPWIREAEALLREEILKRGYQTQKVRPVTCMVEVDDAFVVHFDGTLYKCPAFIGKPDFAAGDLETGPRDYSAVYHSGYWKNEQCAKCQYLPLCFGGCRYMTYVREGRINGVDCRKDYLDACLETLVKQDAKYPRKKKRSNPFAAVQG